MDILLDDSSGFEDACFFLDFDLDFKVISVAVVFFLIKEPGTPYIDEWKEHGKNDLIIVELIMNIYLGVN